MPTRREFIRTTLTVGAGLAFYGKFGAEKAWAFYQTNHTPLWQTAFRVSDREGFRLPHQTHFQRPSRASPTTRSAPISSRTKCIRHWAQPHSGDITLPSPSVVECSRRNTWAASSWRVKACRSKSRLTTICRQNTSCRLIPPCLWARKGRRTEPQSIFTAALPPGLATVVHMPGGRQTAAMASAS